MTEQELLNKIEADCRKAARKMIDNINHFTLRNRFIFAVKILLGRA